MGVTDMSHVRGTTLNMCYKYVTGGSVLDAADVLSGDDVLAIEQISARLYASAGADLRVRQMFPVSRQMFPESSQMFPESC
jgi:hypothetical protein